jgi:hypothetical protein
LVVALCSVLHQLSYPRRKPQSISAHVAHSRPFSPPVHVVILPSQLPLDLRAGHLQVADESRFVSIFILQSLPSPTQLCPERRFRARTHECLGG